MSSNYCAVYYLSRIYTVLVIIIFNTSHLYLFCFAVYESSINRLNMDKVYYRVFLSFLSNILGFYKRRTISEEKSNLYNKFGAHGFMTAWAPLFGENILCSYWKLYPILIIINLILTDSVANTYICKYILNTEYKYLLCILFT